MAIARSNLPRLLRRIPISSQSIDLKLRFPRLDCFGTEAASDQDAKRDASPLRRYTCPLLSTQRIDAISAHGVVHPFSRVSIGRRDALENCGVDGKRHFFHSLFPPVDRFGTCQKKHYPNWFLGVQPSWKPVSPELLCLLSSRFGRSDYDAGTTASLHQKSLSEMA